ncbi:MAG: TrkA family potassium uptake protein [Bacilli bacterium]|nr:TrkA family potassium uptake protein [Bacilli bacterium]
MANKQYVVLGLGVFGSTIAKTLSQFEQEVLAIDKDVECVERVADFVTKAVVGDITDKDFLADLGISEFDVGIVAIGDHLEESILGVMNLKELGVNYIVAKAKNKRFMQVLEKVGADRVVRPEKEMGLKIARNLLRKNITDLIQLDDTYSIVEMKPAKQWIGKSLMNLDLRKKYNINILGKRNKETYKLEFFIDPSYVVEDDDHFLLVADTEKIERLDYIFD